MLSVHKIIYITGVLGNQRHVFDECIGLHGETTLKKMQQSIKCVSNVNECNVLKETNPHPSLESKTTIRGGHSPLLCITLQLYNTSLSSFERIWKDEMGNETNIKTNFQP